MSKNVSASSEKEQKLAVGQVESSQDNLTVHTSPGGTQYVKVIDIILNDRIFGEMERLSRIVELEPKKRR
ncbi:MAG: hypothetical protein ABI977_07905 [Acidobacteriota bacterium]